MGVWRSVTESTNSSVSEESSSRPDRHHPGPQINTLMQHPQIGPGEVLIWPSENGGFVISRRGGALIGAAASEQEALHLAYGQSRGYRVWCFHNGAMVQVDGPARSPRGIRPSPETRTGSLPEEAYVEPQAIPSPNDPCPSCGSSSLYVVMKTPSTVYYRCATCLGWSQCPRGPQKSAHIPDRRHTRPSP